MQTSPKPDSGSGNYRREQTRERLLDAAYDVFAEIGVRAATVEQITDRAHFTRGAFYSNFATKEDLFFALMARRNADRLSTLALQVDHVIATAASLARPIDSPTLGELMVTILNGTHDDLSWGIVVTEFELLALRDPAIAATYLEFTRESNNAMLKIVTVALSGLGLRFKVEPRLGLSLIMSAVTVSLKMAALNGNRSATYSSAHSEVTAVIEAITTST
ncbi:MAG: TetR/AcrR family transcriptional regulator [Actinomycetia bacterium]|nr:TetR/AcrR family transcriptional regulator [Actinomycetes bacterium]